MAFGPPNVPWCKLLRGPARVRPSGTPLAAFSDNASASGVTPCVSGRARRLGRRARQTARCQLHTKVRRCSRPYSSCASTGRPSTSAISAGPIRIMLSQNIELSAAAE